MVVSDTVVDLASAFDGHDVHDSDSIIHSEDHPPTADSGLPDAHDVRELARQARVAGRLGKLFQASEDALPRVAAQTVEILSGTVG